MKGWSARHERVQTGHGTFEELPCLVYEVEGRPARLVACLADGRLEHADSYDSYRSIPLEALQLLLDYVGWVVTPSLDEAKRRIAVHERNQRFEARLASDPRFAASIAAAEARGAKREEHAEAPRMLSDAACRCSVCRGAGTTPSVCSRCYASVLAPLQQRMRESAGISEEEWEKDVGPVAVAESRVATPREVLSYRKGAWLYLPVGAEDVAATVHYSEEPCAETGCVGWCWWAAGRWGDAKTLTAAQDAAESSLRKRGVL